MGALTARNLKMRRKIAAASKRQPTMSGRLAVALSGRAWPKPSWLRESASALDQQPQF
jgi:hypothetical protein